MSMFLVFPEDEDVQYPVVDFIFSSYDANNDGEISHSELCNFLTNCGLLLGDLNDLDDDVQTITADTFTTKQFIQLIEKDALKAENLHKGLAKGGVYGKIFEYLDDNRSEIIEPMEMFHFLKLAEIEVKTLFENENREDMKEANHLGYSRRDFVKVMSGFDKEKLMKVVRLHVIIDPPALTCLEWTENCWVILDMAFFVALIIILITEHDVQNIRCTSAYELVFAYTILKGAALLFKSLIFCCMGMTAGLGETQYIVAICPLISWGLVSMAKHAVIVFSAHEYWRHSERSGDGSCWKQVHDKSTLFEILFSIMVLRGLLIIAILLVVWMLIPLLAIFIAGYAKGARHASEASMSGMTSVISGVLFGGESNQNAVYGINGMLSALGVRSMVQGIQYETNAATRRREREERINQKENQREKMKGSKGAEAIMMEALERKLPDVIVDQISPEMLEGAKKSSVGQAFFRVLSDVMEHLPRELNVEEKLEKAAEHVANTCKSMAGDEIDNHDPVNHLRQQIASMESLLTNFGDTHFQDEKHKLKQQIMDMNATLVKLTPRKVQPNKFKATDDIAMEAELDDEHEASIELVVQGNTSHKENEEAYNLLQKVETMFQNDEETIEETDSVREQSYEDKPVPTGPNDAKAV